MSILAGIHPVRFNVTIAVMTSATTEKKTIRIINFSPHSMKQQYNKYKVRIYEDFFGKELTGQFIARTEQEAITEAKEFYAMSLDTEPEEIVIISAEVI